MAGVPEADLPIIASYLAGIGHQQECESDPRLAAQITSNLFLGLNETLGNLIPVTTDTVLMGQVCFSLERQFDVKALDGQSLIIKDMDALIALVAQAGGLDAGQLANLTEQASQFYL